MRVRRLAQLLAILAILFISAPVSDGLPISCNRVRCGARCNIEGFAFCIWGYDIEYGCMDIQGGCASMYNAKCCLDGGAF